ncbi:actin-related protein 1 [Nakaseomyces bracarensis]|uniref:actin-related protein 1 n=1 Tax=Nakaseomyces bracarensis TaxID=273131 RepID=UPI0038721221
MNTTYFNTDLHNQPIVIDNGSCVLKAGFSGDLRPNILEYNVVGNLNKSNALPTSSYRERYIGNEAQNLRIILNLNYPFQNDRIEHWDEAEDIWNYILFSKLEVENIREHPILLTESLVGSKSDKNKMCEIFYEKIGSPALFTSNEFILSLYGVGRTTGCVVTSGHSFSGVTSIIDGQQLLSSTKINRISGHAVTEYLANQLRNNHGILLNTTSDKELVRMLKERCCFVSPHTTNEKQNYHLFTSQQSPSNYKLPDGNVITIQKEKFEVPEVLFQPRLIGSSEPSIQAMVNASISEGGIEGFTKLSNSIILGGGTTQLPGFSSRLLGELTTLFGSKTDINIYAPKERRFICWIGGSVLTSLSTMKYLWTTKEQWKE